jgi:hypothetical protein
MVLPNGDNNHPIQTFAQVHVHSIYIIYRYRGTKHGNWNKTRERKQGNKNRGTKTGEQITKQGNGNRGTKAREQITKIK